MDVVFIIFLILSFFVVTFALLHLLAGGAALLKGEFYARYHQFHRLILPITIH